MEPIRKNVNGANISPEVLGTIYPLLHVCKVPRTHLLDVSEDQSHTVVVLNFDVPHALGIVRILLRVEWAGKAP